MADHTPNRLEGRKTGKTLKMKPQLPTIALLVLVQGGIAFAESSGSEGAVPYDPVEQMTLSFIFHIDDGMAEQDVFYEKVPGSGEVFRPTAATRDMDAPLYAPAVEVPHNFLDTSDTGPYPKGPALGLTLGEWFAAEGHGTYVCKDGTGKLDLQFNHLVPNGVYTIWHDFMVWPPTDPFIGTYDLPFGARDGSENEFVADASGSARFERTITPCLQLTGEHLAADLALAWHSDGKTYGPLPGEFSTVTHVQMYVTLPPRTGL
ncbi:hypothetical protein [Roseobacter sinensis]|uniref:Uncharacterized protein n=1 Tax=Roseobacter sinensis TaxID=2931391 RepID=A0ABT3BKW3_9RHOB|nr:hypothetical protein [Roseobacter sp. WL0113]MCV3274215.1 hypothetical protein [Roseobacter sp. WL0113]